MSTATDEIMAIERALWTELDDPRTFQQHLAEGGVSVIEPMGVITKEQAVAMSGEAKAFTSVEMSDVYARELTPDCAVLAYRGEGRRQDDPKRYRVSVASTYIRRGGRWQLALTAHQPWEPDKKV